MANPMRWFRRHQKLMMVVFGVGLMVVFGLGTVVSMINPSDMTRSAVEDELIAKWNGGEIRQSMLDNLRIQHFRTIDFLDALQAEGQRQKGQEWRSAAMPISPIMRRNQEIPEELVQEELIRRFLLAEKANKDGIVVNDSMVTDYLAMVGGNGEFSLNDHEAINREVNQGASSMTSIREHLKLELAAQQASRFATAGFPIFPNVGESLQFNERLTREVDCRVYPITVSEFEAKAGEPSDSELKELYEKGKYRYPDPTGKNPGFKFGKKIGIAYFVADFEAFLQNEMNKFSDEEVQKYYETMVENEDSLIMEIIPVEPESPKDDKDAESAPSPRDKTVPVDEDPVPKPGDQKKADESGAETSADDKTAEDKKSDETSTDNKKADDSKADDKKADDKKTDDKSEGDESKKDDKLSLTINPSQSQFVSIQEEAKKQDETAKKEGESSEKSTGSDASTGQDEKTKSDATGNAEKQDDSKNAESSSADDSAKQDEVAKPPTQQNDTDSKTDSDQDETAVQLPEMADKPADIRRPKPLKDVVDIVKREMAKKPATDAVQMSMDKATAEIRTYTALYGRWDATPEKERGEKPKAPDMAAIAKANNLEYVKPQIMDEAQFTSDRLGKVFMFINQRAATVASLVFQQFDGLNMYDPQNANDIMSGSNFLFWITEKINSKVPTFEECRDDVAEFWRKQRALELALEEAKSVAAEVNGKEKALETKFPVTSVATGSFRWFSNNFGRTDISSPTGLSRVSDEFMQKIFDLNVNGATAAANLVGDTVYVVQVNQAQSDLEAIGKDFLENKFFKFREIPPDVQGVADYYRQELGFNWIEGFEESMGLEMIAH